eukprot:361231-Chlamydomonas_euryale.AAC.5
MPEAPQQLEEESSPIAGANLEVVFHATAMQMCGSLAVAEATSDFASSTLHWSVFVLIYAGLCKTKKPATHIYTKFCSATFTPRCAWSLASLQRAKGSSYACIELFLERCWRISRSLGLGSQGR